MPMAIVAVTFIVMIMHSPSVRMLNLYYDDSLPSYYNAVQSDLIYTYSHSA